MRNIYIAMLLFFICSGLNSQVYRSVNEVSAKAIERKALLERGLIASENPIASFNLKNLLNKRFTLRDPIDNNLNRFQADTIIRRSNGLISWLGKNLNNGSFVNYVINTNAQSINGNIVLGKKAYELFGVDPNTALLIDNQAYQNSKCGDVAPPSISNQSRTSNNSRMTGQDCNLRLLFAYTPNSKAMINDMEGYIQARIDYTNVAYDNSNIDFHAEAAFIYETNYNDSDTSRIICWADGIPHPDKFLDLCNFHHVSDPFMPEVHEYRDQYKADMCILIDSQLPQGVTGQAFLPPIINDGEAFMVISVNSGVSTTAHEIGHTQGCHHDYQNDPTATDNHGYVHIGATVDESFRTVMAYANKCVDNFGMACKRIPYFSDPDIFFNGVPVGEIAVPGISGAKNAINIMNQKALVNGFRDYPAFHTLPSTTLPSETFAYPIASNELGNLTTYVIEDSSTVHFSSENYITLRPGFQSQEGEFFEGKIGTSCDPPLTDPPASCNEFGYSVDIDGNFAIVGAPSDDRWGPTAGAAYLYERIGGNWQLKQKIYSPLSQEGDRYGHSVAIHDSLFIIGAPFKDGAETDGGAVYIYKITDTTVVQETFFVNVNTTSTNDQFGFSVDIFNNKAIAGSPGDTENGFESGSVTAFHKPDSIWFWYDEFFIPGGSSGDRFGESVSMSGANFLAGAPGYDSVRIDQGLVRAYKSAGPSWNYIDDLYELSLPEGSSFGHSVAVSNSLAVVGAPYNNSHGIQSGSVHFYAGGTSAYIKRNNHIPSDLGAYDRYGYDVSIDGVYALISAPNKSTSFTSNKLYSFHYSPEFWSLENTIQQPSPLGPTYGHAIAHSDTLAIISALGTFPTCEFEGEVLSYIQAPNGFWVLESGGMEASTRQIETTTRIRQDEGIRRE